MSQGRSTSPPKHILVTPNKGTQWVWSPVWQGSRSSVWLNTSFNLFVRTFAKTWLCCLPAMKLQSLIRNMNLEFISGQSKQWNCEWWCLSSTVIPDDVLFRTLIRGPIPSRRVRQLSGVTHALHSFTHTDTTPMLLLRHQTSTQFN